MNQEYKNIYMFKNPIRHFLNVENIEYPIVAHKHDDINLYAPTKPVRFTIRKYYGQNDQRELLLPNLLNFYVLYEHVKSFPNFENIALISSFSRVSSSLKTGDFKVYNYQNHLEKDLCRLTIFDTLFRFDIKSFYNSIYTHYLVEYTKFSEYIYKSFPNDRYITWLNYGKTGGILTGNYISLYLVEFYLREVMQKLDTRLKELNINHFIENFSDDIYIFSNKTNENKIIECLNVVLFDYNLEANSSKYITYDYITYNNENLVTKYWKTVIRKQKTHELSLLKNSVSPDMKYNMNFINQIIYRMTKLQEPKLQAVFVKNFFKGSFFTRIDPNIYNFTFENLHQLQFIMKKFPETILYIMPKIRRYDLVKQHMPNFFLVFFNEIINSKYYEEQMYVLYGLHTLNVDEISKNKKIFEAVMSTGNQILKSYFIINYLPKGYDLRSLLVKNEENWFLNYHIIMKMNDSNLDDDIDEYLIPEFVKTKLLSNPNNSQYIEKKNKYHSFYKNNILLNNKIFKSLEEVEIEITSYLNEKIKERTEEVKKANSLIL